MGLSLQEGSAWWVKPTRAAVTSHSKRLSDSGTGFVTPLPCASYALHLPFGTIPSLPWTAHFPGAALSPSEGTVLMAAPGDLSDADCAQRILSISPPPCFTPCELSQGHPWSVTSKHVQIVFRKILFSPSWEPATAEGWGGWEGCGGGSHSVLNSALQGSGEVGRCIPSTGRPGQRPCPHRMILGQLGPA